MGDFQPKDSAVPIATNAGGGHEVARDVPRSVVEVSGITFTQLFPGDDRSVEPEFPQQLNVLRPVCQIVGRRYVEAVRSPFHDRSFPSPRSDSDTGPIAGPLVDYAQQRGRKLTRVSLNKAILAMPQRLLVSVRGTTEALAAARGGAHIADVEYPGSALGKPYPLNIKAVRDALDAAGFQSVPISTNNS